MKTYKAYIFDMDGTVLDTLTDLNDALNHALKEHGHFGAYTGDETRHFFGSGVLVALARVLFTEQVLGLTPETVRTSSAPLMEKDFPLAKLYSIGTEQGGDRPHFRDVPPLVQHALRDRDRSLSGDREGGPGSSQSGDPHFRRLQQAGRRGAEAL